MVWRRGGPDGSLGQRPHADYDRDAGAGRYVLRGGIRRVSRPNRRYRAVIWSGNGDLGWRQRRMVDPQRQSSENEIDVSASATSSQSLTQQRVEVSLASQEALMTASPLSPNDVQRMMTSR